MIRPAVEAALEVARLGSESRPPEPPPPGLQRYLEFAKLSGPALRAIAKVVEDDPDFRHRVVGAVDEATVGRAGWLWLSRPEGWAATVEELEQQARAEAAAAAEERDERSARRRLAAARDAAERATATADAHRQEVERLRTELADERSRRASTEERAEDLSAEVDRLRDERARAVRELKDTEAKLASRAAEAKEAKARLRELESSAAAAGEAGPREQGAASGGSEVPGGTEAPGDRSGDGSGDEQGRASGDRPGDIAGDAGLTEALRAASAGAGALAEALDRVGELVARRTAPGNRAPPEPEVSGHRLAEPGTSGAPPQGSGTPDEPRPRGEPVPPAAPAAQSRSPLRLPGGVLDDSVEAVDHLLRAPNVLALVDGYNVTMAGWPDLLPAGQRARLVSGLDGVAARSGAELEVVFDGADVEPGGPSPMGSRDVRVRFSPPGVEADDVLLDVVAAVPPARPVVLVSSDNRVRSGARRHGANLVHAHQLLALLRP